MSWREFRLIQSRLGWICLVLASLHVVFSAWSVSKFFGFSCFFPSPALVGIFLPALTIITKIPLLVFDPCLTKIRSGQNARDKADDRGAEHGADALGEVAQGQYFLHAG